MALNFEQLIRDTQGYPDGYEIPFTTGTGDTAVTERLRVGDIRGQLANTFARYEAALQTERDQKTALEATLNALKTNGQSTPTPAPLPNGAPSEDDLNSDAWSKALRAQTKRDIEEAVGALRGELNGFSDLSKKGVGGLTKLVLRTIANQDYNGLKDWPDGYNPTKAFEEAGKRGYLDAETGLPDLRRLHHDLTEDSRIEQRAKARAEKMYEDRLKAEAEKNQSRFNRTGVPGSNRSKQNEKKPQYRNLQEYMMDDANLPTDDELRAAGAFQNAIR